MSLSTEVYILLITNLVSIGMWVGSVIAFKKHIVEKLDDFKERQKEIKEEFDKNIKRLEEKQDKHNNLIERMTIVEQSTKAAHHRIDEIRTEIDKK